MFAGLAPWHIIILVLLLAGFVAYWAPTIVAVMRKDQLPNVWSVLVINFFLGWTLVGWVVALALACRSAPTQSRYVVPPSWVTGPGQQPPAPPTDYPPGRE
jgi:hypothetical protein